MSHVDLLQHGQENLFRDDRVVFFDERFYSAVTVVLLRQVNIPQPELLVQLLNPVSARLFIDAVIFLRAVLV